MPISSAETISPVSHMLAQSSLGWSVCSRVTDRECSSCEYRDEFGGRLPFSSFYGRDIYNDENHYWLCGCDWKMLKPGGSSQLVPLNERVEIANRIVRGLDALHPTSKNVFNTSDFFRDPTRTIIDENDTEVRIRESGDDAVEVRYLGKQFRLPLKFHTVRHKEHFTAVKLTDLREACEAEGINIAHQVVLISELTRFAAANYRRVLVVDKY